MNDNRQRRNIRNKLIDRSYLFPYHKIKKGKIHFVCHPFKIYIYKKKSRTNNPAFIFTIKTTLVLQNVHIVDVRSFWIKHKNNKCNNTSTLYLYPMYIVYKISFSIFKYIISDLLYKMLLWTKVSICFYIIKFIFQYFV